MNNPEEAKKAGPKPSKFVFDLESIETTSPAHLAATSGVASIGKQIAEAASLPNALIEAAKKMSRLNIDLLMPTMPSYDMKYQPTPNPAYETNHLLHELSLKLDILSGQNAKLIAPHFYPENSEIIFANKRISIPKNTNQAELCNALFRVPDREWDWSEMLESWGYNETEYGRDDWRRVYTAAREVNTKVAIETGVKDLLSVTKKTVTINPNYLGQIS